VTVAVKAALSPTFIVDVPPLILTEQTALADVKSNNKGIPAKYFHILICLDIDAISLAGRFRNPYKPRF
jgi:hypothetical protein